MKTDIHPKYHENIKVTCSCGNVFLAGSVMPAIKTEICSACHPYYTGQQKLLDTTGRVDRFRAQIEKAQKLKEQKVKKIDKNLDNMFEEGIEADDTAERETASEVKEPIKKTAAKKAAPKKKAAKK